ncbi:MAG: protein translocase subunit SecD [Candidatus Nealsonbacteria bacterium]|nr:protein translocase subunit SecD [Candidatus Nealsonbacteria bacterium]
MKRNNFYIILIAILTFFALNFSYPAYLNLGIDRLNSRLSTSFPHFWDVPFRLGLDLRGGIHLLYEADLSKIEKKDHQSAMQGLRDVIERRVNIFGVKEPSVQVQQEGERYRLIVELAGVMDPAEAIKMIGETPFLEFREKRLEDETKKIIDIQKAAEGKTMEEVQKSENWQMVLEDPYFKPTQLTGRFLAKAELNFDQTTYQPIVSLQFNSEGAEIFKELTSKNIGKPIAIYVDNSLISAPVVQEVISGGKAQITGRFTVEEAKKLAQNLSAGALPLPIKIISQQNVGPTLGKESLDQSLRAGIFGFLAIILFLIVFYRLPGFLASLALLIYIALVLTIFKFVSVTLTLAGIAGFILSIGMAIDANVLVFSRLREELKEGKDFSLALSEGFSRAWPSIRDGNITTILVGIILFFFGTGFVQGFALTLVLGNIISIFSAVFITKVFLEMFIGSKLGKIPFLW